MTTDRDRGIGTGGEATVDSIVGRGTRLNGHVDLKGMLRIDGEFNGEVRASGQVLIGRTGRTECTVHAGTVIVAGVMRGNIVASERVELRATATMSGTIHTPRLIVEDGGRFSGRCHAGEEEAGGEDGRGDASGRGEVAAGDDRPVSACTCGGRHEGARSGERQGRAGQAAALQRDLPVRAASVRGD